MIVKHDRTSEGAPHRDCRQRRQKEPEVRAGEHVHNVRMGQFAYEQREIGQLGGEGTDVPDVAKTSKQPSCSGVDGNEPRIKLGIAAPRAEEAIGLHGLAAEDVE